MSIQILDHLWQSTVILGIAGVLTLLLRKNSAGARYWLWFAASMKFLIPLTLLAALVHRRASQPVVPILTGPASEFAQRVSEPFVRGQAFPNVSSVGPAAVSASDFSNVLLIIWGLGCAAVLLSWLIRWRRIGRALSSSRPLSVKAPILLRESPTLIEPGLVGIWSPVILLPVGLRERLAPAELHSILAHEFCHYRRRDNLTAAVHMLVEALFWFYLPIWWLGARLIAERERACDEAVLAAGNDAEVYADSILKVCRFFKPSALACTSGVSGADLRRRVEEIMSGRNAFPVGRPKKILLTISIAAALFGMVLFGGLSAPSTQAQASRSAVTTPAEHAKLLAEQTQPQKEVPFNPADFDKFEGYYKDETTPDFYARVYRTGGQYYSQLTSQQPVEFFPESQTEFFATVVAAQISFVTEPNGQVTEMSIHQNGFLRPWQRISKSAYEMGEVELQQRIKNNKPSPGTDASLRRFITSWEAKGRPNYEDMEPALADSARQQAQVTAHTIQQLGAFESLKFVQVNPIGMDIYEATFAHGVAEFMIAPLDANGKVVTRSWHVLPSGNRMVMPVEKSSQSPPNAVADDPSKIYHIGQDASPPRLIHAPDPIYPPNETRDGVVVVKLVVDTNGMPQQVRVVHSSDPAPAFSSSAIHAVEQYRFTPATLLSNPKIAVAVEVQIEVNFRRH